MYLNAEPPFAYYLRRRDRAIAYRTVRPEPDEARRAFAREDGSRRLWWVTSGEGPPSERARLLRLASEHAGPRVDRLSATGAAAYLHAPAEDRTGDSP